MRILIVTCGLSSEVAGISSVILQLAKQCKQKGHTVIVVGNTKKNPKLVEQLILSGIRVENINLSTSYRNLLSNLITFIKLVKQFKPDVIHTHDRCSDIKSFLICKLFKIKHIITIHGIVSVWRKYANEFRFLNKFLNPILNRIWFHVLKKVDHVVAVSEAVKYDLLKTIQLNENKIVTIYNTVDLERFSPISYLPSQLRKEYFPDLPNRFTLTFVGRLVNEKKPEYLILLVSELVRRGYDCQGVFVGDGPLITNLQKEVQKAGLIDRIFFLGKRNDMPIIYNISDIVLNFHEGESFGLAVAEALSCGRPVLAVAGGNIPYLIKHNFNGFLINDLDVKVACDHIVTLIEDNKKWIAMALNARKIAENLFGKYDFSEKYLKLYSTV
jgi:glycosyltransferase involved in cell wall biosynthesis